MATAGHVSVDVVALEQYERERSRSPRGHVNLSDFKHSNLVAGRQERPDFLKRLYPHDRDDVCRMVEATHTYMVSISGEEEKPYPCSVTAVIGSFFDGFEQCKVAQQVLRKAETRGLVNLENSIYNLWVFLRCIQGLLDGPSVLSAAAATVRAAQQKYEAHGWPLPPPYASWQAIEDLVTAGCQRHLQLCSCTPAYPEGDKCYFLCLVAGATAQNIQDQWARLGTINSMRGTILHKQAELMMQTMAEMQIERGLKWATVSELMALDEARILRAADYKTALRDVAYGQQAAIWDQPFLQAALQHDLRTSADSHEFRQLVSWLRAHPSLSPYRSEWSVVLEEYSIAGQIDSLWFDVNRWNPKGRIEGQVSPAILMVDWKRARKYMEDDAAVHARGRPAFPPKRGLPGGPCAHFLDTDHNHYLLQQSLYAYFLSEKYDVHVEEKWLVQIHPDLRSPDGALCDVNNVLLPEAPTLAKDALDKFVKEGWGKQKLGETKWLELLRIRAQYVSPWTP